MCMIRRPGAFSDSEDLGLEPQRINYLGRNLMIHEQESALTRPLRSFVYGSESDRTKKNTTF
jgi:hypothetical protein